jgi:hypothetical protein
VDCFGYELTAIFDYCAKDDKLWGSKYCGISDVGMGLSRKILHQGVDSVNLCVHKRPPKNDNLSRCHLTPNLLTTTIVALPSNVSKWQMGFNSAFKGLMLSSHRPNEFSNVRKWSLQTVSDLQTLTYP